MTATKITILLLIFLCTVVLCGGAYTAENPLAYHAFGDSITAGFYAGAPNQYVNVIQAEKHLEPLANRAIPAQLSCDMADTQIFPYELSAQSGNPVYTEMIGTNDAISKGVGAYENNYNACLKAALSWLGVPSTKKTFATACRPSGTWSADNAYGAGIGLIAAMKGASLSCTITTTGGPIYAWYRMADVNGGTFSYSVDGGPKTTINTTPSPPINTQKGGMHGENVIRITGLPASSHKILFTTANENPVSIGAIGTPGERSCCRILTGGVMYQQNDQDTAATAAYNKDAQDDVALLKKDGLDIVFVDVRHYVNATSDMIDLLHPNDTGHRHLADAFEAMWERH